MSEEIPQARTLTGYWDIAVQLMMAGVALFLLWASSFGVVSLQYFRGIAVLYSLVVPLLLYRGWRRARMDKPCDLRCRSGCRDHRRSRLLDRRT